MRDIVVSESKSVSSNLADLIFGVFDELDVLTIIYHGVIILTVEFNFFTFSLALIGILVYAFITFFIDDKS